MYQPRAPSALIQLASPGVVFSPARPRSIRHQRASRRKFQSLTSFDPLPISRMAPLAGVAWAF
eukprot:1601593-Rhodomonas_salina.1